MRKPSSPISSATAHAGLQQCFFDSYLYCASLHGATFQDLEARGRPIIAIDATDIAYGTPFAASNGFTGLFSPVTLSNHEYIHLSDGGVSGGLLAVLGLVTGAQIDSYNFETLTLVNQQVQLIALRDVRCAMGPVVDGTRCDDVKLELVHLSLAGLPETPEKQKLLAIPTGLTLKREDVDLLVQSGHDGVINSDQLRNFLADYPPAPLPARVSRAGRKGAPTLVAFHP